jgi:hypothetical protein
MSSLFDLLAWHDAQLLAICIDRTNPGKNDTIKIKVRWPSGIINTVVFSNCYRLDVNMNFGIIAEETIAEAYIISSTKCMEEIKLKWNKLGIVLDALVCYRFVTNSTNSLIEIYATELEVI